MNPIDQAVLVETRRQFFGRSGRGLGSIALASLLGDNVLNALAESVAKPQAVGGVSGLPHFAPKAKRAIYLHMVGAPPQLDLYDYKPGMKDWYDKDLPESVRKGQRLTTMTAGQSRFPIAPSIFKFQQQGQSGAWVSELHFAPKAKRAIYLHMVGAPPQLDLYDYKPGMKDWYDKDLPESVRKGQRLTTMTAGQSRFPIAPSIFKFQQQGQSGAWVSELLPHTAKMVDDMAIIRSVHTEAINHEPAITFIQTGNMIAGKPCMGAWIAYGLGSMNQDLPTFVVLNATHSHPKAGVQAISARLWSAGFLSAQYAGVALRSGGDPVLYINNPDGVPPQIRRQMLDGLGELNHLELEKIGDPETQVRIAQYEMAFRMQTSVPELTDLSKEPESTYQLYGEDARKGGTFANGCLMARRLVERGVRFVQLYHRGWDVHNFLPEVLPSQCKDVDQGCWGLVQDLKSRGLLDSTLVIWGGEFGRTIYSQGKLTATDYGRDHHPRCFSLWMAGGGIKGGTVYGETDEFSYNIVNNPVHVRDLQATILNQFGIDHEKFSYKYLGLDQRLTGVEPASPIKAIIA